MANMKWSDYHQELEDVFSELYLETPSIRRIMNQAGLDPRFINFNGSSVNIWDQIIEIADQEMLISLIINAMKDHPRDKRLWKLHKEHTVSKEKEPNDELRELILVEIKFVIAAMKWKDASGIIKEDGLERGAIWNGVNSNLYFQEISKELKKIGINNLVNRYGSTRCDWKPLLDSGKDSKMDSADNIECIIRDVCKKIEDISERRGGKRTRIKPCFESKFLGDDEDKRKGEKAELRNNNSEYVLIIDAISIFDPILEERLNFSGLIHNPKVAVIIVYPINSMSFEINRLIEKMISERLNDAHIRFYEDLDKLCDISIGNQATFNRRLDCILTQKVENASVLRANSLSRELQSRKLGGTTGFLPT